jgi:hypothetical protein
MRALQQHGPDDKATFAKLDAWILILLCRCFSQHIFHFDQRVMAHFCALRAIGWRLLLGFRRKSYGSE